MYNICVVSEDNRIFEDIAALSVWSRRSDFELCGYCQDESDALEYIKNNHISLVLVDSAGRSAEDIGLLAYIRNNMPEVYTVIVSMDSSFRTVRDAFVNGAFDYLLLPISDFSLEDMFMRMYSDFGSRYIYTSMAEKTMPLLDALLAGSENVSELCKSIVSNIYKSFDNDLRTAYIVAEKTKTYIYDEFVRRIPWIKRFIFKNNFVHAIGEAPKEQEAVIELWQMHFQTVADTVRKYSILENSLIKNIGYYVVNHVDEHLSLEKVSGGVYLNKSYISHIFKKVSGVSFVNFITEVKMDRAKILLMDPKLKIYQIASQISYNNPEYFSRVFKSETGMTPNQFRNKLNINEE